MYDIRMFNKKEKALLIEVNSVTANIRYIQDLNEYY